MHQLASLLSHLATGTAVVGARPAAAGDGVDITAWRSGSYAPRVAMVLIDGDQALDIAALGGSAGVELWGLILAKWKLIGFLHASATIPIVDATHGYAEELDDLGAFTRLAIAGTPSIGAATYGFVPMETTL